MANVIKLKNSVTTTTVPSSLEQGEVAINITDKKMWVGNASTTPILLFQGVPQYIIEDATIGAVAATGTINYDLLSQQSPELKWCLTKAFSTSLATRQWLMSACCRRTPACASSPSSRARTRSAR